MRTNLMPLNQESFDAFGIVLDPPASPGRTGRLTLPANLRRGAAPTMTLIHLGKGAASRSIDRMERHRHSGQAFLHMGGGGLLVVVAPRAVGGGPDATAAVAFATVAGQCFCYHPDIWHAGVSALDAQAIVASLHCCDGTDEDVEQAVLEMPLSIVLA